MSEVRKAKHGGLLTAIFSIISVIYVMPIIIVLYNSFKKKIFISKRPFALPDGKSFVGMENYISGIEKIELPKAFGYSLFITVASVFVIILCTSMCAWYITRVKNKVTSAMYMLFAFSMIIPFQMVRNCREIICIFLESMLIYVMNEFSDSGGHFHGT